MRLILVLPSFSAGWGVEHCNRHFIMTTKCVYQHVFSICCVSFMHILSLTQILLLTAVRIPCSPSRIVSLCGSPPWFAVCATSSSWVLLGSWAEPALPQTEEICRANLCAEQITVTGLCQQQLLKQQHNISDALWQICSSCRLIFRNCHLKVLCPAETPLNNLKTGFLRIWNNLFFFLPYQHPF